MEEVVGNATSHLRDGRERLWCRAVASEARLHPTHTVHLECLPQTSLQGHRLMERTSPSCSMFAHTAVGPSPCARPGAQHDRSVNTRWLSVHCVLVMGHVMAHSSEPDNIQLSGGSVPTGKPGRGGCRKARRDRKG